jgi:dTDP-4-amino-4,6-dideoxygalactose transaminase
MKLKIDDLAILGGPPEFEEKLHVGKPNIGNREKLLERFNDLLDRRWLTNNGPYVQELEKRIADYIGVKHCISVCNATIGLEIAIRAIGLSKEVIAPAFTFVATVHALQWQEITPVFCDLDPATHNLDPNRVEDMITPKTTGILGVHVWGRPCAIEELSEIARKHNLKLMFDAAHAFGCSHQGKMLGNFGAVEVFSFHATKLFNTFEGGAIVTNDDELARQIRLMTNFGFTGYDQVVFLGTNGKMSEVSAAMGITNLESLGDFIEQNKQNYQQYEKGLAGLPGIKQVKYDETEKNNFQYIAIEIDADLAGISRDLIAQILYQENVLARRYFYPGCHQMEPYASYFPHAGMLLPETEKLTQRTLCLPTGTAIDADKIQRICQTISLCISNGPTLSKRLSGISERD